MDFGKKGTIMLVTFSCKASESITMFGNVAHKLLRLMGNSGTVPGAILAEDVPEALESLQQGIARMKQQPVEGNEDDEPDVSLAHRALPLIELLKRAVSAHCNVMWE
jgi:hypothetical protein